MLIELVFLLLAHLLQFSSASQLPQKENLRLVYLYRAIRDTTGQKEMIIDTMHLDIYPDSAFFYSKDYCEKKLLLRKDSDRLMPMLFSGMVDGNEMLKYNSFGLEEIVVKDYGANTLKFFFDIYVYYTETLPVQKWIIHPDTLTLKNGIFCQKATTTFAGREYVVWFSPKFNVSTGPWKFHGLPGMVVKAYDTRLQFGYDFIRMETFTGNSDYYYLPEAPKKTTKQSVQQRMKLSFENAKAYDEMHGITTGIKDNKPAKRYNPQELTWD
ncbi:MAG: GLPGLI family protein [Lacibacter sp.]